MKIKINKGMTMVALIITIIVILILAVVTINIVTGNGILNHAENAKLSYSESQENEQITIQEYTNQLDDNIQSDKIGVIGTKINENLNRILNLTENVKLEDKFGNKINVPAGFKILVDSTTDYTADNINVTKGIVVEDAKGNQFVWIPIGKIKNEEKTQTINLERNTFGKNNVTLATEKFDNIKISRLEEKYKTTSRAGAPDGYYTGNLAVAADFLSKATESGGYYIGRYEARTEKERTAENEDILTEVTSKANDFVYNKVTQLQASELCKNMYINLTFESALINSYAWDTAIIFFQEFSKNSDYANKESVNNNLLNTGTSGASYAGTKDVICNVYDMASNCEEWTTEIYSDYESPCAVRKAGNRGNRTIYYKDENTSFRVILYM